MIRRGRFVVAELAVPHRVITTSRVNGGERTEVRFLVNHQSCEAAGHGQRMDAILEAGLERYHCQVCEALALPAGATAVMGTAANMQCTAVHKAAYEEFAVVAAVTAGVAGNAARAGDPAHWVERDGRSERTNDDGTINTMLLFNASLTGPALVRAIATMTEAKSAVLQELAVPSCYSDGLATGTGTDQFCLAAPSTGPVVRWAGTHSKIGEMIAAATMAALREALRWQNGLEPSLTRDLTRALGRFGLTRERLMALLDERLPEDQAMLARKNMLAIVHDPQGAACAYAIAAVRDRVAAGALPEAAGDEAVLNQCALLAAVVAARPEQFVALRERLAARSEPVSERVASAVALGLVEKWRG